MLELDHTQLTCRVNWIHTTVIFTILKYAITIRLTGLVPLQFRKSLKDAIIYAWRHRGLCCISVWTILPSRERMSPRRSVHLSIPTLAELDRWLIKKKEFEQRHWCCQYMHTSYWHVKHRYNISRNKTCIFMHTFPELKHASSLFPLSIVPEHAFSYKLNIVRNIPKVKMERFHQSTCIVRKHPT